MGDSERPEATVRFGVFEVNPRSGELRKSGTRIRLQDQPFKVLIALLERPGELVTREELRIRIWPRESFGDFDHAVNIAVAKLRAALADSADVPRYIETLYRRGYRFIFPIGSGVNALTSDKMALPPFEFGDSIAVLPFENAGRDPEMEYLSDGITETVINNLSRLKKLRVVPRSTVFRYKGKMSDPAKVGRELRVRLVLTGQVIHRGSTLIVGTELIDTAQESLLWGETTYNRKPEDILAIQDEIAREISNTLQLRLSDKEKEKLGKYPTENREAYHLHLKAMYFANKWTQEGLRKGLEYTRLAIDADPGYADAYVGLAYLYTLIGKFGGRPIEAFPRAKAAVLRALELDPSLPNAHAILGFILLVFDWDSRSAETELRRGAELSPNLAGVHYAYSFWYIAKQLYREAMAEANRALELDPLSSIFSYHLGAIQFFSRQYDQAINQLQQASELDPHFVATHGLLALAYARKGMGQDAMVEAEKAMSLSGGDVRGRAPLGLVSALLGKQDEARKVLDGLGQESGPPNFSFAYACAEIHALLGEKDQAFDWLDKAVNGRTAALVYIRSVPEFESLHGDPRFDDLLRRIGLAA
jgi:TolB-like protein/Tfp pilus assembly protein PilF